MPGFYESSRRANYRVVYPLSERPSIEVGGGVHEIVDVSERGLRYEVHGGELPELGTLIRGIVGFKGSTPIEVTGEVIRRRTAVVVLALEPPGVPYSNILNEQRHLRSKGFRVLD